MAYTKEILLAALLTFSACGTVDAQTLEQNVQQLAAKTHVGADGVTGLGNVDMVRMAVTDDLAAGSFDAAVNKARDLVTAEPNNANNHLLLARAITAKFKRDEPHNRLLYEECLSEWSYVNRNLSDPWETDEAKNQLMELRVREVVAKLRGQQKNKTVFGRLLHGSGN